MRKYLIRDKLEGGFYYGLGAIHGKISFSELQITIGKVYIWIRNVNKHRLYFSERNGYTKIMRFRNIALRVGNK